MKQALFTYLVETLYPTPSCDTCENRYKPFKPHDRRNVCNRCEGCCNYKLHKGHSDDVKQMVKDIVKIVMKHSF